METIDKDARYHKGLKTSQLFEGSALEKWKSSFMMMLNKNGAIAEVRP